MLVLTPSGVAQDSGPYTQAVSVGPLPLLIHAYLRCMRDSYLLILILILQITVNCTNESGVFVRVVTNKQYIPNLLLNLISRRISILLSQTFANCYFTIVK